MRMQLELQLAPPPDLPDNWVDPEHMGQVLRNLCNNALLQTPEGGSIALYAAQATEDEIRRPSITARCLCPSSFVFLRVIDRGSGIAPEHLANLFDRFYGAVPAIVKQRSKRTIVAPEPPTRQARVPVSASHCRRHQLSFTMHSPAIKLVLILACNNMHSSLVQ